MRKIIALTQVTLDGVMQSPGGPEEDPRNGFTHGGWVIPFWEDALGQALGEIIAGQFDLLLGRRTYDIWAGYWPKQVDNPIGKAFNKATKYIATRGSGRLDWAVSKRIGPDVVNEVRRLKATNGPALHIWGSHELLQALIAAELMDEYRMLVFPVVLGKGKRLFENGVPPSSLPLVETRSTPKGVLINTYRSAGPVNPGPSDFGKPSDAELARRFDVKTCAPHSLLRHASIRESGPKIGIILVRPQRTRITNLVGKNI
jgi:dihydrofolate reductase